MSKAPEAVTLEIAGAKLTVNTRELFLAWLDRHLAMPEEAVAAHPGRPSLGEGEHYAGILLGKDGAPDQHLILLPGEPEDINWQDAKAWAAKAGGELPARREQSLLFANLKEQFKGAWYWSCEQHAGTADYAWAQSFSNGGQFSYHEGHAFRARAVRRVVIE